MADNTVILRVQLDEADTEKKLHSLVLDIEATKKAQADLTAARKAGTVADDDFAKKSVELRTQLRGQQQEQTALTKNLELFRTASGELANTYKGTQAQLSLGQIQLQSMAGSADLSTEATQHLSKTIDGLRNTLKTTDGNMSLFVRNVGNYNGELKASVATTQQVKDGLQTAANKGLGLFSAETERASGLLNKFKAGGDLVKQGLAAFKGAGETGSLGFKAIASGIALTGIGLFVIAISAVVAYFTQSAEGGKILAGILGGLGGVLQVATDLIVTFGKEVIYAVTHPKTAIVEFGQTLLNALRHPIDTARGLASSVGKVADRVKDAYEASSEFAARSRELTIARRELDKQDAINESRVAVLLRLTKDRTKSSDEQLASLREAGKIEAEVTQGNIALKNKELKLIDDKIKAAGTAKTADLKADKAAKELEIIQATTAQDELNAKIKTRESVFLQQRAAAAAAAAKQRAKDAVAALQTENELALVEVEKGSAAELVLKQRAIDLAADREIAGEKKTVEQVKLIRAQAEGDKNELARAYNEKAIEEAKKHTAATAAEAKREYEEATRLLNDYLAQKRADIERDYANGKIGENQYQKQLNAIEKAGIEAQVVVNADYNQDNAKQVQAAAALEIKENKRVKEERKRIEDEKQQIIHASVEAATTASDLVIQAFGEESAAGEAALAVKKAAAIIELGISLEKQIAANAEAGAKISAEAPPFTVPLGIAYTVATDALAIATSAASVSKILGFRQGGVIVGPPHEQGGVPFTVGGRPGFEAEGGEIIMTKGVWNSPVLRPLASALNVLGGGAPLMPRTHMAVGGVTPALIQQQLRGQIGDGIDYGRLAQALEKVRIYTRTQDTVTALDGYKYTQNQSNT